MAGLAALFTSTALPFPSTSSPASSCSCRFRLAVACAPRHPPASRRVTRRFDEVEGASKKRRGGIGGGGGGAGSLASSTRKDKGLTADFKESQVADFEDLEEDKFLNAVVKVYCKSKGNTQVLGAFFSNVACLMSWILSGLLPLKWTN